MRAFKIKSKFKDNESFDYRNVPKQFMSVTNKNLEELRNYCLRTNEVQNRNNWEPGALGAMLRGVIGRFNEAQAQLIADYSSRRANLDSAYLAGKAALDEELINFEANAAEHNNLFAQYAEAYEKFMGKPIDSDLSIKKATLAKMRNDYDRLK